MKAASDPCASMFRFIDSHVHLDFPAFDADREQVVGRAQATGVGAYVLPAVTAATWPRLKRVAETTEQSYACYGLHPCFVAEHRLPQDIDALHEWVLREQPIAVGECGLDFYQGYKAFESEQRAVFEPQLQIARSFDLPVVLHARRALDAVLKSLRQAQVHSGVVHSFAGSLQQAKAVIDQGLHIGVGGTLTYPRANKLRQVIKTLPLDALVLETDAPDQPTAAHRGYRNEPAYLHEVFESINELRPESPEVVAEQLHVNTVTLFRLQL